MRIVFIGPPGAGKGTQSERLLKYLNIPHLATGDMLRKIAQEQSPRGERAQQYMSEGKLVPDDIILELVAERLNEPGYADGVLFDGFPRTLPQAEALDARLEERGTPLDVVLELRVSDDLVIERLSGRGRADDRPEIIAQRLKSYWRQTQPLLDYYKKRGLVETIDGVGTPDEVFERIMKVVDQRCPARAAAKKAGKASDPS